MHFPQWFTIFQLWTDEKNFSLREGVNKLDLVICIEGCSHACPKHVVEKGTWDLQSKHWKHDAGHGQHTSRERLWIIIVPFTPFSRAMSHRRLQEILEAILAARWVMHKRINNLASCCRILTVSQLAKVSQASGSTWESSKSCYAPRRKPLWSPISVFSWPDWADETMQADKVVMALVSIFISKTHNHFWSAISTYKSWCTARPWRITPA